MTHAAQSDPGPALTGPQRFADIIFHTTRDMIDRKVAKAVEELRAEFESRPALSVTYDGERTLMIGATAVELPIPLYKGVWQPALTYRRGDLVTREGALWHLNAPSSKQRPGLGGSDWQLAVKSHGKGDR